MARQPESLVATASGDAALRIEFSWREDRFAHTLWAARGGQPAVQSLTSREGAPGAANPPSPPLQSLSVESLAAGKQVALLVGMAGRGHWSASIEPLAGAAAFLFDLACRWPADEQLAGSRYALAPGWDARFAASNNPAVAEMDWSGQRLVIRALEDTCQIRASEEDGIQIVPKSGNVHRGTLRWKYEIRLQER